MIVVLISEMTVHFTLKHSRAYPLHFLEKAPKGTKQGAKSPEVLIQDREIGVFLAFSRFPERITRIEQDFRRRTLYPAVLRRHIVLDRAIRKVSAPCFRGICAGGRRTRECESLCQNIVANYFPAVNKNRHIFYPLV